MQYGSHSTDETIREGCLRGDRLAQKALYQRYHGKLLGIPMRYTKDIAEAKALMNQAFLKIFNSLESYREEGSFEGKEPVPDVSDVEKKLAAEDIFQYIQQLPDYLRAVFSLYVIDGYKHEEIAENLGITLSASKWRLAKARELLQASLGKFYNRNGKSA